eukprot:TRINITY_DN2025_c0_g1_i3.p1 TRINITY_DN2025_c0_g1~~TRINITY_DN2025_c0_g1_i3.p1  ORF type:complete len:171 (+),score=52.38 TRINITY_DN2025_c0_g1_i3:50-562(+)
MDSKENKLGEENDEHPTRLIPHLCRLFYNLGWVTGTGGGISIRQGNDIYIAPSGVQKERIESDDMFVMDPSSNLVKAPPSEKNLKQSQCTPLFFNAYSMRDAGAVIHTHSQAAVMVTLLFDKEFRITHQEMIKGIRIGSTKQVSIFKMESNCSENLMMLLFRIINITMNW